MDPFLWMQFDCLKATEPLREGSSLFTTKFPESPGTENFLSADIYFYILLRIFPLEICLNIPNVLVIW